MKHWLRAGRTGAYSGSHQTKTEFVGPNDPITGAGNLQKGIKMSTLNTEKREEIRKRNRKHLNNLTDQLIRSQGLWELYVRFDRDKHRFLEQAIDTLYVGPVKAMSPAKLGEIMHEFEDSELPLTKPEIFKIVTFAGSTQDFHRDLVSLCLAAYIFARMDPVACVSHRLDLWVEKLRD